MSSIKPSESVAETVVKEDSEVRPSNSFWSYLGRKTGGASISLIMVVLLGFFAFRVLPGDPVTSLTKGKQVTATQLANLREIYGLDEPLWTQFGLYLSNLVTGNLGTSYTFRAPVATLIAEHLYPTLLLTSVAAALSISLGLWVGQRSIAKRGGWFDRASTAVALTLWSVPTFWLGLLLLMFLGGGLQLFPVGGMVTAGANYTGLAYVWDVARHLALPVTTMVAVTYAQYMLVLRASLIDEMSADYLVTARAKGLRDDLVRRRHAVPNALLPTVTLVFMHIGGLIGGAVTVETVFSWPGLGYLTFQALTGPDLPLLQGTFVVFSVIVIIMNLAADLIYRALDPRVRLS